MHNIYGYIYKTTILDENSKLNNHYYIGQHKWSSDEIDPNYFGSGKILKLYIAKHGIKLLSCEIIDIAFCKEELDQLEINYISTFLNECDDLCLNKAAGGTGGNTIINLTKQERKNRKEKASKTMKEKHQDPEFHQKWLEEQIIQKNV